MDNEYVCKICNSTFTKKLNLLQKNLAYKPLYCSQLCAEASRFVDTNNVNKIQKTPQSSKEEIEFGNMLKSYFPLLESQYRIKGYEHCYDFYSPELKLLIEYDGVYWHNKPTNRDRKRLTEARKQHIKFCIITDVEWKLFMNSGLPDKKKILKLLNYNIKN